MDELEIIISVVSIIISGLLSWLFTSIYYKKSNRNLAFSRIGKAVFLLTFYSPNEDGLEQFRDIITDYEFYYLKKKEQKLLLDMFWSYQHIVKYSEIEVYALALNEYFLEQLEKNNMSSLDIKNLFDDPPKLIKEFLIDNDYKLFKTQKSQESLINFLNSFLKDGKKLDLNCVDSIPDSLNKSHLICMYKSEKQKYYELTEKFNITFSKDIPAVWHEIFLEDERYHFN